MIKSSDIKKGDLLHDYEFPAFLYVTDVTNDKIGILVLQPSHKLKLEVDAIMRREFDRENTVEKLTTATKMFNFIFEADE